MEDLPFMIVIAFMCLVIGIILANLFHSLRSEPGSKTEKKKTKLPEESPIPDPETGWLEVARLWRDETEGQAVLEMENRRYRLEETLPPETQARLNALVQDLSKWLVKSAGERSLESAHVPAPALTSASPSGSIQIALAASPASPKPNRQNLLDSVTKVIATTAKIEEDKSIAAQVDEVLQEMIKGTPLAEKGLRLTESPSKGLLVWVGIEKFEGIDEVPQEEIRLAIRTAVEEWKKRTDIK